MHYYVGYSGGVTSWACAKLLVDKHGPYSVTLLFADTRIESDDLYTFLHEGAEALAQDMRITILCDGRTPWEVMADVKMIGSDLRAVCSRVLKRDKLKDYRERHCDPTTSRHAVGMDWLEVNRFERHAAAMAKEGWTAIAPLIDAGVDKAGAIRMAKDAGLTLPAAYTEGFSHANCAGMCVRSGIGHWRRLLALHPERFNRAAMEEWHLQRKLGVQNTYLRRWGRNVSLLELKALDEQGAFPNPAVDDGGGCGCALELGDE